MFQGDFSGKQDSASMASLTMSWLLLSCLMLLSGVQGEDSQESSPRLSCPQGSVAYASHCYALYLTPRCWMDAEINCQKRPAGHLVSILSRSEGSFVASLIKNNLSSFSYIWIGLHDPTEGYQPNGLGWAWSSTEVLNHHAWEKIPPSYPYPGYCGSLTQNSGFQKWKDFGCNLELPYVCKFMN